MYKISIIIPAFNVEKYIERSFKSILNQTMDLNDIEVIVVDDKSTDKTRSIVEKYEKKYPNFKAIYHKTNSGGAATPRNSGLEIASGKYVMFLDPDDEFAHDMCETLYSKIDNDDSVAFVKCNHEFITTDTSRKDYQLDENISELKINCKTGMPPKTGSVCNAIHDRCFLMDKNLRFPKVKLGEDAIFMINEFLNADNVIILNNYHGYKYYTNAETSHSRTPIPENFDDALEAYSIINHLANEKNRPEIACPLISRISAQYFLMLIEYEGNKKEYLEKYSEFEKSLNCTLTFKYSWMNIVNKLLIKNKISTALSTMKIFNLVRKSPLVKIYRKFI